MAHVPDLSGTNEALFQLRHLACGSRELCRRELLHSGGQDYTPDEWEVYQGQLHFLVSRTLINSAINFRVLQDTLRTQAGSSVQAQSEEDFGLSGDLGIGIIDEGYFKLNLRESCNKIIHATELNLIFHEARTGKPSKWYSYWGGTVLAVGWHSKKRWGVFLDVSKWCDAVDNYIGCFAGELEWR